MKFLKRNILVAAAALFVAVSAIAQDSSSSSSVVRRRGGSNNNGGGYDRSSGQVSSTVPGSVTQRAQSFYEETPVSDADMQWMKVVYRQLDLAKPKNLALYYPEDLLDGQENLFRMILRLLADNEIDAYEYLDGREIFNDQYRINVRDMLDRFYIPYTAARNSSDKNPRYEIQEYDVPTNEILSYYIIERYQFDTRSNRMKRRVEAICPVLHREGDFGYDVIKYPMFWVKLDDLRPYMAQQLIFTDDDNNLAKFTYDDYFVQNMYDGELYKTRNLANKSLMQLYPDPDDLKHAQDSIENRLANFGKNLWVPDREEVFAARQARNKKAQVDEDDEAGVDDGDSTTIKTRDDSSLKKSSSSTTKRSSRAKQPKKIKEPKQSSPSSSSAVRSVRRRK